MGDFNSFEKGLREDFGLERVRPKDKYNGSEDDQMSGVMHTMSRRMIEYIWKEISGAIEVGSGIVPRLYAERPDLVNRIATLSPEDACCELSKTMNRMIGRELTQCITRMDSFQMDDMDQFSAYINYKSTLQLGGSAIGSLNPIHHMTTGFKTGVAESWRIILESCRAFQHQYGQSINLETLKEISENSNPLLLKIASTHMRIFANYSTVVNGGNPLDLGMNPDPSLFQIEGSCPQRSLGVSSTLMAQIGDEYFDTDEKKYMGCPALYAKGVHHSNVIQDLYQEMVIPAALHYLKPLLENR